VHRSGETHYQLLGDDHNVRVVMVLMTISDLQMRMTAFSTTNIMMTSLGCSISTNNRANMIDLLA
jgi:hypothetical protein